MTSPAEVLTIAYARPAHTDEIAQFTSAAKAAEWMAATEAALPDATLFGVSGPVQLREELDAIRSTGTYDR